MEVDEVLKGWNYILSLGHVVDLRSGPWAICSSVHTQVRFAGISVDTDCGTVWVVKLHSSRLYLNYFSSVLYSFPNVLPHRVTHPLFTPYLHALEKAVFTGFLFDYSTRVFT